MTDAWRGIFVRKDEKGVHRTIEQRSTDDLPTGDVRIQVLYSSVNYKDALAATGHPGVVRKFPHVPGIDAAGVVLESSVTTFAPGDRVVVTGRDLGVSHWGGWATEIRVPSDWVLPLPSGLTLQESMVLGTAGFTAAQSVSALVAHGVTPESGEILVTGATGGVGGLAVRLLSQLEFSVVAVTGKAEQHERLLAWGAKEVISRGDALDETDRPLLSARWAGSVDTVGGNVLATTLRSLRYRGCVTACGLTAGSDLNGTVYPFLLRGISLVGIDSAACPTKPRSDIWRKLASEWKLEDLVKESTLIQLEDVDSALESILAGQLVGRYVIDLNNEMDD